GSGSSLSTAAIGKASSRDSEPASTRRMTTQATPSLYRLADGNDTWSFTASRPPPDRSSTTAPYSASGSGRMPSARPASDATAGAALAGNAPRGGLSGRGMASGGGLDAAGLRTGTERAAGVGVSTGVTLTNVAGR